jgi:integrase/recombinase XerD
VLTPRDIADVDRTLVGTPHEHRNRAMLFLQLATGLRAKELTALDVGDVFDAYRNEIRTTWRLEKRDPKGAKAREVFLHNAKARNALLVCLRHRDPEMRIDEQAPLFLSQRAGRLVRFSVVRIFADMYRAARIKGASSHSRRRWYGRELRRRGVDLATIQRLLGHSSLATTQRYLGVTAPELEEAAKVVEF